MRFIERTMKISRRRTQWKFINANQLNLELFSFDRFAFKKKHIVTVVVPALIFGIVIASYFVFRSTHDVTHRAAIVTNGIECSAMARYFYMRMMHFLNIFTNIILIIQRNS